jgi:hypothetical protein
MIFPFLFQLWIFGGHDALAKTLPAVLQTPCSNGASVPAMAGADNALAMIYE